MATYATKTEVSSQKSRMEIENTLERYGATSFAYASQGDKAMIGFEKDGRTIRFVIPLPDRMSREFTHHERGVRTETAQAALYEQAVKQKWRAMALMVKAKLEGVESGIVTFEQELFPHTVLASGRTLYEEMGAAVTTALESNSVPPLIALGSRLLWLSLSRLWSSASSLTGRCHLTTAVRLTPATTAFW